MHAQQLWPHGHVLCEKVRHRVPFWQPRRFAPVHDPLVAKQPDEGRDTRQPERNAHHGRPGQDFVLDGRQTQLARLADLGVAALEHLCKTARRSVSGEWRVTSSPQRRTRWLGRSVQRFVEVHKANEQRGDENEGVVDEKSQLATGMADQRPLQAQHKQRPERQRVSTEVVGARLRSQRRRRRAGPDAV